MKERLINYFSKPFNVVQIICCVIAIILSSMLIHSWELFTPPKEEDYEELHNIEEQMKDNFDLVYSIPNANIIINEDYSIQITIVSTKNSEYKLQMSFNKEKEWIESKEICSKLGFEDPKHPILQKIKLCGMILVLIICLCAILNLCMIIVYGIFGLLFEIFK